MIWLVLLNTVAIITIIVTVIDILRGAKTLRIRQDRLEEAYRQQRNAELAKRDKHLRSLRYRDEKRL